MGASSPGMDFTPLFANYTGSLLFVEYGVLYEVADNMDGRIDCTTGEGQVRGVYFGF